MKTSGEKILVRGVNWLGDAVMTTPALQRLREAKPEAQITLLTHEKLAALWQSHPAVNSVLPFKTGESAWQIGRKLRLEKFDLGLALPNSHRSALELFFGGIPNRIGYARPFRNLFLTKNISQREGAVPMRKRSLSEINRLNQNPFTETPAKYPAAAHHIFQYLHLVAALGANPEPLAPHLSVAENAVTSFRERMGDISSSHKFWLGLNPGAEYGPAKRWPAERFVAAAVQLHQKTECGWIIFGAEDRETNRIAEELQMKIGRAAAVNLAGKTTLGELCAGLKFCQLVLTNDTGPMHVAAALGTPVVVPFGSTSPELTGPGFGSVTSNVLLRGQAPCSPCFLRECPIDFRCMKSITVEEIVEACLRIFKKL
ncbi:MAG: lipopolysaccharide heptosyltransferase II [Verrucomicrobiota bacterium]